MSVIAWLRTQLTEALSLETRLARSFLFLFFRPGFLTREWVEGRRASYVSPLRLFLIVVAGSLALTFFVGFLSLIDLPAASELVDTEHGLAYQAAQDAFETRVRVLLFGATLLLVPAFGLALRVVNMGSGTYLVDHLVFSLHVLAVVVVLFSLAWLATPPPVVFDYFLSLKAAVLLSAVYFLFALRGAWRLSWFSTGLRSCGMFLIIVPLFPVGSELTGRFLRPTGIQWIQVYRDAVALPAYERWKRAGPEDPRSAELLREADRLHMQVIIFDAADPWDEAHLIEMSLAAGQDPRSQRWAAMNLVERAPYHLLALGWAAEVLRLSGDMRESRRYLERYLRAYPQHYQAQMEEYAIHIPDFERFRVQALELEGLAEAREGPGRS